MPLRLLPLVLLISLLGLAGAMCPAAWSQSAPGSYEQLVEEGLELYKNDQNAEALSRFQQALRLRPHDFRAEYGVALVYYTTGRYAEAAAACEQLVARGDDRLPNVYVTYGTALDRQQQSAAAVQVYQRAIQKFPADEALRRYQGIALQNLRRYAEAAASFQQAVRLRPDAPAAHLLLAQAEALQGHRIPALLACLCGLLQETHPASAARARAMLDQLLRAGVQPTSAGTVAVSLPAGLLPAPDAAAPADEFALAATELTLETAADYTQENATQRPAERLAAKLTALCQGLARTPPPPAPGFAWQYYVPFFRELGQRQYTTVLAYRLAAQRPAAGPEAAAWLQQHAQLLQEFADWHQRYPWPR